MYLFRARMYAMYKVKCYRFWAKNWSIFIFICGGEWWQRYHAQARFSRIVHELQARGYFTSITSTTYYYVRDYCVGFAPRYHFQIVNVRACCDYTHSQNTQPNRHNQTQHNIQRKAQARHNRQGRFAAYLNSWYAAVGGGIVRRNCQNRKHHFRWSHDHDFPNSEEPNNSNDKNDGANHQWNYTEWNEQHIPYTIQHHHHHHTNCGLPLPPFPFSLSLTLS